MKTTLLLNRNATIRRAFYADADFRETVLVIRSLPEQTKQELLALIQKEMPECVVYTERYSD
jgi:hypothetical protein